MLSGKAAFECYQKRLLLYADRQVCFCMLSKKAALESCQKFYRKAAFTCCQVCLLLLQVLHAVRQGCFCMLSEKAAFVCSQPMSDKAAFACCQ